MAAGLQAALMARSATDEPAERAEAGQLACFFHYRLGQLDELLCLGEVVVDELDQPDRQIEQAELLRWMAIAGADTGRFDMALRCAEQAHQAALRMNDTGQQAQALNTLGACFERMGDPWQGERLMLDGLVLAEADGGAYVRMAALNNLCGLTIGAHYLLRGVSDAEARAALERSLGYARRAVVVLDELEDPFFAVFVEGNLGEVLLHLGQVDAAGEQLRRTLQVALRIGATAQAWRIRCSLAEEQLARGQAAQAREALLQLTQEAGALVPQSTALRLHHGLYSACKALGRCDEALAHFEQHERLHRQRAARQLRAQSELLVTRLEVERARLEAQTERARASEMALHARQDALTGLGNRRHVDTLLPDLLRKAQERGAALALVLVDIDHFKLINDRHGHLCGDRVLVVIAQMLRENTRSADLLARIGGEEFMIALPETEFARAIEVCERLRERVAGFAWGALSDELSVTISIGLAQSPPFDADELFDQADRALYRAKQAGRNRVRA